MNTDEDYAAILKASGGLQKIDIRHEYSGSGMKKPSALYGSIVRGSFRAIVKLHEFGKSKPYTFSDSFPPPSRRLLALKKLMAKSAPHAKPTWKQFRQPFFALCCPVLPRTSISPIDLSHTRGWWVQKQVASPDPLAVQVLYVHGAYCCIT
jgi:hypothetical protein